MTLYTGVMCRLVYIVLPILATIANKVACICPEEFTLVDGNCYLMADNTETWTNAKCECESFKFEAWLAEPKTRRKYAALQTFIETQDGGFNKIYWIGANCMMDQTKFEWQTGTDPKYINAPMQCGVPESTKPEECLSYRYSDTCRWHFDEDVCSDKNYFICETSASPSGPQVDVDKIKFASDKFVIADHKES